jgi:hypothetical protein
MSRRDRILKQLMLKGIRLVLKFRTYLPLPQAGGTEIISICHFLQILRTYGTTTLPRICI